MNLRETDQRDSIVWSDMYPRAPNEADHPCFMNTWYRKALQKTGVSQCDEEIKDHYENLE